MMEESLSTLLTVSVCDNELSTISASLSMRKEIVSFSKCVHDLCVCHSSNVENASGNKHRCEKENSYKYL
jgi:hypothetical protein